MAAILVAYGTGRQTAKVAEYVGDDLAERGHDVTLTAVGNASAVDVEAFDGVLVGSPVNNRSHLPEVVEFVEANRETLSGRPSAFFQLSFASIVPSRWAQEGAGEFVDDLVERTGWQPDRVGLFAGAVRYTQYDFVTRLAFKLFSAVTTGDTDTSRDYEYTDWREVDGFADGFAALVERHVATRAADVGSVAGRLGTPDLDPAPFVRPTTGLTLLAGVLGVVYWLVARRRTGR